MMLLYMKLLIQLPIDGFHYLPHLVNPPPRFFGQLRFLVATGQGYQIDTVGLG